MKLACVAPAPPFRGGIAHFGVRLARELAYKHSLQYFNFSFLYPQFLFPGKTQLDNSKDSIKFYSFALLNSISPYSWYTTGKTVSTSENDAVIFHWWHPFLGPCYRGVSSAIGNSVLKLAVCHNVLPHEKNLLSEKAVKFGLSGMDGYIVHGKSEEMELSRLFPGKPILRLYHPIYDIFAGTKISKSKARKAIGINQDRKIALYFGLIRDYKGVEVLLEALELLSGKIDNFKCLIVGEIYSNRKPIVNKVKHLGRDKVKLLNRYVPNEDVAKWFRATDIVVLPYLSATQSGIIPIAYQCNRPVITTNVGGLPDMVEDGQSGYLIEPNNPNAIANAIIKYFDTDNIPDMTDGITKIAAKLSWQGYADGLETFINQLKKK